MTGGSTTGQKRPSDSKDSDAKRIKIKMAMTFSESV